MSLTAPSTAPTTLKCSNLFFLTQGFKDIEIKNQIVKNAISSKMERASLHKAALVQAWLTERFGSGNLFFLNV
jgi:hypothetical protein